MQQHQQRFKPQQRRQLSQRPQLQQRQQQRSSNSSSGVSSKTIKEGMPPPSQHKNVERPQGVPPQSWSSAPMHSGQNGAILSVIHTKWHSKMPQPRNFCLMFSQDCARLLGKEAVSIPTYVLKVSIVQRQISSIREIETFSLRRN
jgi:hypothetical protein